MPTATKKSREAGPHHESKRLTATDQYGVTHLALMSGMSRSGKWISVQLSTGCRPRMSRWSGEHPHPLLPQIMHGSLLFVLYGDSDALVTCVPCEAMRNAWLP